MDAVSAVMSIQGVTRDDGVRAPNPGSACLRLWTDVGAYLLCAIHRDAAALRDQPAPRPCRLDIYVCDYLRKRSLQKCAELFALEANVPDRQLGAAQPRG